MKIPWKQGRRALVWDAYNEVWVEAVGRSDLRYVDGAKGWLCCPVNDEVLGFEVPADSTDVRLLPNQCPRCFEVDDHEQGCMVDANLARGVPAFWAPWAMVDPVPPSVWTRFNGLGLYGLKHGAGQDPLACTLVTRIGDPCDSWVAIGPDGPTLEPWGQS